MSLALPKVFPEGQAPTRCVSRSRGRALLPRCRFGRRDTTVASTVRFWSECAPRPASLSRLRRNRHAVGSQLPRTLSRDDAVGLRRSHLAGLGLIRRPVGFSHITAVLPSVASPRCDPGPNCAFLIRSVPASGIRPWAECVLRQPNPSHITRAQGCRAGQQHQGGEYAH